MPASRVSRYATSASTVDRRRGKMTQTLGVKKDRPSIVKLWFDLDQWRWEEAKTTLYVKIQRYLQICVPENIPIMAIYL